VASEFVITIGGINYGGWTSVRVTRSLEQLAHSFSVSFTDRWTDQNKAIPAHRGDACTVLYRGTRGDQVVTTGWIDENTLDYDATTRTLGLSGRSTTGDLCDCAAIHQGGSWSGVGLLRIAQDLCRPFGVSVSSAVDLGRPFSVFKLNDGETVFQALERACRMRGVIMTTHGSGALVFQRTGQTIVATTIERGVNILRGSKRDSHADRFSQYTVKIQMSAGGSAGDDMTTPHPALKRTALDSHVTRYRPTIITAETEDSGPELQKRADWERNVRAGRACRLTYTVQGWENSAGLWAPNTLVRVVDQDAEVDDELLIVTVTFERSGQGTTTTLELTQPGAFDVEPLPPKVKKKGMFDF
jgi:prophage tail gpP-like protein